MTFTQSVPRLVRGEINPVPQASHSTWAIDLLGSSGEKSYIVGTVTVECYTYWYLETRYGYVSQNECKVLSL